MLFYRILNRTDLEAYANKVLDEPMPIVLNFGAYNAVVSHECGDPDTDTYHVILFNPENEPIEHTVLNCYDDYFEQLDSIFCETCEKADKLSDENETIMVSLTKKQISCLKRFISDKIYSSEAGPHTITVSIRPNLESDKINTDLLRKSVMSSLEFRGELWKILDILKIYDTSPNN